MPGIDLVPACIVLFFVAIVADLVLNRRVWTFVLGLSAILLVVVLALLVENSATGKVGLGADTTPYGVLAGMFVAIVLGIGARYVFELKTGAFSWLDLVKPIMISPIVLLPLIGSI